ncbi:hypothetical protein B7P43_G13710, partial [Cryptotermes secundus]
YRKLVTLLKENTVSYRTYQLKEERAFRIVLKHVHHSARTDNKRGNSKTYCNRPYACAKCGGAHNTSTCKKSRDIPARCALCNGDHPTNYKGCEFYHSLLKPNNANSRLNIHHQKLRLRQHGNTSNIITKIFNRTNKTRAKQTFLDIAEWNANCLLQHKNEKIASVYCPPRYNIKKEQFSEFFQKHGPIFLARGDFNCKHTLWGSSLTTTKGRELADLIQGKNCSILSTGQKPPILLHNRRTNWEHYRTEIEESINLKVSLQNPTEVDYALTNLTTTLTKAAEQATPKLQTHNKVLLYKTIIKPIWAYGIELWGCASKSNISIIQRSQSKILRIITNAPWYVNNQTLHTDLNIPYIKDVIREKSTTHQNKLANHQNDIQQPLVEPQHNRRLRRHWPADLKEN